MLYKHQLSHTGALLDLIIGERAVTIECEEERLLLGAYRTPAGIAINIANIEGTIPEDESLVSHRDKLTHYLDGAERLPEMEITVKCGEIKRAYLQTPEYEGRVELPFECDGENTIVKIPANTFAAYALILLEE